MALPEFNPTLYQPFPTIVPLSLVGSRQSLRASQALAIEALARQSDVKTAAKESGVDETKLRHWLRDPDFKKKLAVRRRQWRRSSECAKLLARESEKSFVRRMVEQVESEARKYYRELVSGGVIPDRDKTWHELYQGGWTCLQIQQNDPEAMRLTPMGIRKAIERYDKAHGLPMREGARGPRTSKRSVN
jgi:hypothetical protein